MARGETYEQFVDKFKPKKTTDDCYTPDAVMDVVNDYVEHRYNVSRETFIRPFWPGGDFEHEDYTGKVVVDNPPFSILAKIVRFYQEHGVPFFLFCNGLTGVWYGGKAAGVTYIGTASQVVYRNGANIRTAFITNMEPENAARSEPGLTKALNALRPDKSKGKTPMPPSYWTSSRIMTAADHDREIVIPAGAQFVKKTPDGKEIYGGALIYEELDTEAH